MKDFLIAGTITSIIQLGIISVSGHTPPTIFTVFHNFPQFSIVFNNFPQFLIIFHSLV